MTVGLGSPACTQNLLTNPSFEEFPAGIHRTDGTYVDHDWRYFSVNGAGGAFDTVTPGQDGNIAVKLSRGSTSGDSGLDREGSLLVPVVSGQRYRATVWAKAGTSAGVKITLAPYDANRQWLSLQSTQVFGLGADYAMCVMEYVAPANTAYLNFAIRCSSVGSVYVDNCELVNATTQAPQPPGITYPAGEVVDSFQPTIAFAGAAHSAYQVVISQGETSVWDSGEVSGTAYSIACPVMLSASRNYQVKARLLNSAGWSGYSNASPFATPPAPVVRITSPEEADPLRGPTANITWQAESPTGITGQSISIDDGTPLSLPLATRSYALAALTEGIHSVRVEVASAEGTASASSRFYVRITPAEPGTIYYYDLSYVLSYNYGNSTQRKLSYDICMAVAALQGLVNRSGPRLFVKLNSEDSTWWNRMRESGNWLANKTVVTIPNGSSNLHTLFETFTDDYAGAVIWDPNVDATANVACTVAGADNLIPIRYDTTAGSVYSMLVSGGPQIPVHVDLRDRFTGTGTIWQTEIASTGSKKNDAYIWARAMYLETGKCNPEVLMYGVDAYWISHYYLTGNRPGNTLVCRDYVIQNKGFVFDLGVWEDETPVDDPTQTLGLDVSTFRSILYAAATRAPGMVHVVGFVPWPMKYTNWASGAAGGTHDPVPTEWEYARWLSSYNAYMDADAYDIVDMASASIYSQFPLPDRLTQNRKLSLIELRKLGYVDTAYHISPINFLNIYMGDYDSACWLERMAYSKWNDSNRGTLPISWAFNPNHLRRVAAIYEYYNRTRTIQDSFIAGDCGAGYLNPSRLLTNRVSGLPSARDKWIAHNLKYFRATDTKISGFLINGTEGPLGSDVDSMYAAFSPDGTFSQPLWYPQGNHLYLSMPALLQQRDLAGNATTDADIVQPAGALASTQFLNYRTVLQSPSYVKNLFNNVVQRDTGVPWALVDARTYASLASCYMGKVPDNRATYTFDTIPGEVDWGTAVDVSVGVRNEGWVAWPASGTSAVKLSVKWKAGSSVVATQLVTLPHDVAGGTGIVLDFALTTPVAPGDYTLTYEMQKGSSAFSALGDYAWEKTVTVLAPDSAGTPAQAKAHADGDVVAISGAVVTAGTQQFASEVYLEDEARISGIKVSTSGASGLPALPEGSRVGVVGAISTLLGERVLTTPSFYGISPGDPIVPLAMNCRAIGGGPLNALTPGISGGSGAHNTGLLITAWGRVTASQPAVGYFYIDDGTGRPAVWGGTGIYVYCKGLAGGTTLSLPSAGQFVKVTGISSRMSVAGVIYPMIKPRQQSDIVLVGD